MRHGAYEYDLVPPQLVHAADDVPRAVHEHGVERDIDARSSCGCLRDSGDCTGEAEGFGTSCERALEERNQTHVKSQLFAGDSLRWQ